MVGGIVVATAAVVVALWWAGTAGLNGDKLITARFDALRTGLSIGIGGGGALALYLSWRRQRAAEITLAQAATALAQKDRDHEHTETDARERRITDLYTKAVEQLGSDKAPVRLGGLYALERVAQGNPSQRQTIVNVLCAYLRMPYLLPGDQPADDADVAILDRYRERVQEREVRATAQRILSDHLRIGRDRDNPASAFWPSMELDFTGATLVDFDFSDVNVRLVRFNDVKFTGTTMFNGATFVNSAWFGAAQFEGFTSFNETLFGGTAWFEGAKFRHLAHFASAKFEGLAWFDGAVFDDAWFSGVAFKDMAYFASVKFGRTADFTNVQFGGLARFKEAYFGPITRFDGARFNGSIDFDQADLSEDRIVGNVPSELERYLRSDGDESSADAGDSL